MSSKSSSKPQVKIPGRTNDLFQRPLTIQEMKEGELADEVNTAILEAVGNIQDLNTDWRKPREVTLKLKIQCQDETRESVAVYGQVTSKLIPVRAKVVAATIAMEMVGNGMKPVALEIASRLDTVAGPAGEEGGEDE